MAKKKTDRRRAGFKLSPRDFPTSSSSEIHPNATVGPDTSVGSPTTVNWTSQDSTNAPEIGEEETPSASYAQSTSALIDKYLLSRDFIPFALLVVGIGWIFLQDNGNGNLQNLPQLLWTIEKSGALFLLFIILLGAQWVYKKLRE
ncbi:MAG: hypothetical protein KGS09_20920 [Nitrospirae bacterium]|nr:hypothetical protein [Nitrospirota bacterium]MBU6482990.1 hypothetical protein [Nitrospirota bacterium]